MLKTVRGSREGKKKMVRITALVNQREVVLCILKEKMVRTYPKGKDGQDLS